MIYVVKVERKIGELPTLSWKLLFEREFEVTPEVSLSDVIDVLHVLYRSIPHRVLVVSSL